jgi:hypothetical protein
MAKWEFATFLFNTKFCLHQKFESKTNFVYESRIIIELLALEEI